MNDTKTKSQIVEKITGSTNILVAVSNSPSVDALSAAIGLTLILNKLNKHTTAIFSGAIPPAITFLDPQKTFEASIDSLRDFIIALDKEKADHLRYKVDGDVVKIFITPYRTTISSDDLEFSKGDYNVELVLALGVENQAHLDSALEAHGSILHDAAVVTISTGQGSSSLGSIDWRDETASSLSEMLVGLAEALQTGTPLIDQEIATALLTGIVAETDRFSNPKTTSKIMTMAAQLMAAGADQQLIAAKLQESHEIGNNVVPTPPASVDTQPLAQPTRPVKEGLVINHDVATTSAYAAPVEPLVSAAPPSPEPISTLISEPAAPVIDTSYDAQTPSAEPPVIGKIANAYAFDPESVVSPAPAEPAVASLLGGVTTPLAPPVAPVSLEVSKPPAITPINPMAAALTPPVGETVSPSKAPSPEESGRHSYIVASSSYDNSANDPSGSDAPVSSVDIFADPAPAPEPAANLVAPANDPLIAPTEKDRDEVSRDDALAAVSAAYGDNPPAQAFSPVPGITLPPPPPLPDFSALPSPVANSPYALDSLPQQPPERLGDILAPSPPASNDPGQFKIPGQ